MKKPICIIEIPKIYHKNIKDIAKMCKKSISSKKKKTAILLVGGTIVCEYDPATGLSTPAGGINELLERVEGISESFDLITEEIFNCPGSQLTLDHGMLIAARISEKISDPSVDGVVVIQGTDTLDEMAYLMSLLLPSGEISHTPVVFTGAMKSNNEMYMDASGNIYGAVQAAASDDLRDFGVLVYMNQQIFSALDVEKSHSNRIDAFSSPFGPVAVADGGNIYCSRKPISGISFPELLNTPDSTGILPQNIYIIKSYAGMDERLLRACLNPPAKGIVLEGMGAGNVQPAVIPSLNEALAEGIPVLMTTRCPSGAAFGTYDYAGGGAQLQNQGVIFARYLSSQKARILLSVLLAAGIRAEDLGQYFN